MERITISIDDALAREFDAVIRAKGYVNRSEAMRDVLRQYVESYRLKTSPVANCVASVSYVFNHHERDLARRVTSLQHDHHDLTIASMHAHLDADNCIETVLLRGKTDRVQAYASRMLAETGIKHGSVNLILAEKRHEHPVKPRNQSRVDGSS